MALTFRLAGSLLSEELGSVAITPGIRFLQLQVLSALLIVFPLVS